MRPIIKRLTEQELRQIVESSVQRIMEGKIDTNREIRLAYNELQAMGKHLSSLGLRLEGTRYRPLFGKMKDAMVELNNKLINSMKGGGK